jgi:ABC-type Fe3+-hydroxamate transport system substrate-binding protein
MPDALVLTAGTSSSPVRVAANDVAGMVVVVVSGREVVVLSVPPPGRVVVLSPKAVEVVVLALVVEVAALPRHPPTSRARQRIAASSRLLFIFSGTSWRTTAGKSATHTIGATATSCQARSLLLIGGADRPRILTLR